MPRGAAPGERRGGRTKGTPNRRPIKSREELWAYIDAQTALGRRANPFHVLVDTMLSAPETSLQITCAQALADRLLPRLKAVELSTNIDNLAQALALLRALPDAELARMEHPDGLPLGLPHELA